MSLDPPVSLDLSRELPEPPESFTYGGVLAHILEYGAIRREALAGVLTELGAEIGPSDPILWELKERM